MARTESYKERLLESLKDAESAAHYLTACLEDEDPEVFLLALRDVAEARGGLRQLARRTGLNRENLYRMLSRSGNPALRSLAAVLASLGLRISVQPKASRRSPGRWRPVPARITAPLGTRSRA
jgi:probable addiction module antidote protein